MVPHAQEIIQWAKDRIGTKEQPIGSNDGADLRTMLSTTAFRKGDAWCMFFAEAAVKAGFIGTADFPRHIALDGSCHSAAILAARSGQLSEYPATGCIALFRGGQRGWHHAGIVIEVYESAGLLTTIEGNTNTNGSVEGYEVCSHTRRRTQADFIIW